MVWADARNVCIAKLQGLVWFAQVTEQCGLCAQAELRNKVKQVKVMSSELHVVQAKVNEDKYEIERLKRELQATKQQFFAAKRRERDEAEREQRQRAAEAAADPILPPPGDATHFLGGGYAITAA